MQHAAHASIGAWTLGPSAPVQAWGDAFRSISLMGSGTTTLAMAGAGEGSDADAQVEVTGPIDAARRWLQEPARREQLDAVLVTRAEQSLDVAEAHVRELDVLAGELAHNANETGVVDAQRLDQVERMAEQLQTFSATLRDMLEPTGMDQTATAQRLTAALEASAHGGGLGALLSAL